MFYVYQWFNKDTGEIFYVGKGCNNRYKTINHRNSLFLNYLENHNCDSKIIAYFEKEEDAFKYEHEKILELKAKGQCSCNLDDGGTGGVNFIWTPEMRKYKSIYNPMKTPKQRQRMSEQNPMYNQKTKKQVAKSKSKIVVYNGEETSTKDLSKKFNVKVSTIQNWAKRGYSTDGTPCYYKGETLPQQQKKTCSKAIFIDGQLFPSLRAAADFLNVKDTSPLCKALKNNKKYKGHECYYANQQPSNVNSNNSNVEGSETNG